MYTEIINLKTWKEINSFILELGSNWVFRGQESYIWGLSTSFDRFDIPNIRNEKANKFFFENFLLSKLRNNKNLIKDDFYYSDDFLQQLAFLQHYGAPTRLLDFTWSPYVALFFAIENSQDDSAVYAISAFDYLFSAYAVMKEDYNQEISRLGFSEPQNFFNIFLTENDVRLVALISPNFNNFRLRNQLGCFLAPANVNLSFEQNLVRNLQINLTINGKRNNPIYKIKIFKELKSEILWHLSRMNITRYILFPDTEGLVKSFKNSIIAELFEENYIIR